MKDLVRLGLFRVGLINSSLSNHYSDMGTYSHGFLRTSYEVLKINILDGCLIDKHKDFSGQPCLVKSPMVLRIIIRLW
jgi:hypothetical protein